MNTDFTRNNFDVIRIFAAVQVMILHVLTHMDIEYPLWFQVIRPFSGVPMFFVISGFLISASYERNSDLKNYIRNRALRIYPGLWCVIFLTILTIIIFSDISFVRVETIPWLLSQLAGVIYTPGFLKDFGIGAYHVSLWTIPIELQFYAVLPVLYLLIKLITKDDKTINWYFILLFLFFLVVAYVLYVNKLVFIPELGLEETTLQKLLRYSFIPHIYMFLFGVVLQRTDMYRSKWIKGKGLWWCILFLVFTKAAHAFPNFWIYRYLNPTTQLMTVISLMLLCITTISLAYTKPGFAYKFLHNRDISYGVYIYHGMVLNIFIVLGLGGYSSFIVISLITIILAYLSWIYVERPFIKKKKKTILIDTPVR